MEQNYVIDDAHVASSELGLSTATIGFLTEIRKWANFLSILGFIGIGLMVIFSIFAGTMMSAMSGMAGNVPFPGFVTFIYILLALLYFFPILYLYRFAANLKTALAARETVALEKSFEYLKSHYKYIGILAIIMLGFYALALIGGITAGLFSAGGF